MRACLVALLISVSLAACGGGDEVSDSEKDQAVAEAEEVYDQARTSGVNLETGPCIAESLTGLPDWVVDVAHDPREDVDDDPANQCRRYRDGEASHFVELSPEGELIRAD